MMPYLLLLPVAGLVYRSGCLIYTAYDVCILWTVERPFDAMRFVGNKWTCRGN